MWYIIEVYFHRGLRRISPLCGQGHGLGCLAALIASQSQTQHRCFHQRRKQATCRGTSRPSLLLISKTRLKWKRSQWPLLRRIFCSTLFWKYFNRKAKAIPAKVQVSIEEWNWNGIGNGMFNGNGKWNEEGKAIGMVIFLQRSSIINKGVQNCTYSGPFLTGWFPKMKMYGFEFWFQFLDPKRFTLK